MTFARYLHLVRTTYAKVDIELDVSKSATPAAIKRLSNALGFSPSKSLCDAWLTANGSLTPLFAPPERRLGLRMLAVDEVLDEREGMRERASTCDEPAGGGDSWDARILNCWFQHGWVPFAEFGGGSVLLMEDHSPSRVGETSQIIAFVHDPDEIE
jgi:cell wall assembly regulator SMI1